MSDACAASRSASLRLAVLDMAGTTVQDEGLVELAFGRAFEEQGIAPGSDRHEQMLRYARDTMGTSRINVFHDVFDGDRELARRANRTFELAYDRIIDDAGVRPVPGAEQAIAQLREAGLFVCLSTGFARRTQNKILEALGWMGLADLSLCPDDAGRGRPYPDMILTAVMALDLTDVREVLVAGDSTADVVAGRRAGAAVVAGVLTGAHSEQALRAAGATAIVPSVRELPALVAGGAERR